jgi:hypothetical protein
LLGSSSVVTKISYGKGSVTYSTFDPESTDVLRLDFVPESVTASGRSIARGRSLPPNRSGFVFDESTHVLRIRHEGARDIDIQGSGGHVPLLYVTFDDPHLAAGTGLEGAYPSGVIDWPRGEWKIGIPDGKFGTFNAIAADPKPESLEFAFHSPRVFAGFDVYNGGSDDATIAIRCENLTPATATLRPGELRRIRTSWNQNGSRVSIDLKNGEGLRFDNLAYSYP